MLLDFIVASTASQIKFSLTLHKIGCGLAKRYLCIKLWLDGDVVS